MLYALDFSEVGRKEHSASVRIAGSQIRGDVSTGTMWPITTFPHSAASTVVGSAV